MKTNYDNNEDLIQRLRTCYLIEQNRENTLLEMEVYKKSNYSKIRMSLNKTNPNLLSYNDTEFSDLIDEIINSCLNELEYEFQAHDLIAKAYEDHRIADLLLKYDDHNKAYMVMLILPIVYFKTMGEAVISLRDELSISENNKKEIFKELVRSMNLMLLNIDFGIKEFMEKGDLFEWQKKRFNEYLSVIKATEDIFKTKDYVNHPYFKTAREVAKYTRIYNRNMETERDAIFSEIKKFNFTDGYFETKNSNFDDFQQYTSKGSSKSDLSKLEVFGAFAGSIISTAYLQDEDSNFKKIGKGAFGVGTGYIIGKLIDDYISSKRKN